MKSLKFLVIILFIGLFAPGCVSKKKLNEANAALEAQKSLLAKCDERTKDLENQLLEANKKAENCNNEKVALLIQVNTISSL